jgi:hypothetical protein
LGLFVISNDLLNIATHYRNCSAKINRPSVYHCGSHSQLKKDRGKMVRRRWASSESNRVSEASLSQPAGWQVPKQLPITGTRADELVPFKTLRSEFRLHPKWTITCIAVGNILEV